MNWKHQDDWIWKSTKEESVWSFLLKQGVGQRLLSSLAKDKLLRVDGFVVDTRYHLIPNQEIRLAMPKESLDYEPIPMDLHVLYEDRDILVIDKPVGITVNSSHQISVANGIAHYFREHEINRKVRFLNRLDRDTSGCLVIAKSALAQSFYQKELEERVFHKYYETVVEGELVGEALLELPIQKAADGLRREVAPTGKMTKTKYVAKEHFVRDTGAVVTRVEIELLTGKTHQIRVSMAYMGHPLEGDVLYGGKETAHSFYLRAKKITWIDKRSGEAREIVC